MRNTAPECLVKLRSVYNTLRPKPALVADFILENPEEVVNHNIGDLARMIGVSQFSVINCIKAAGYNGFSDFKIALARSMGREDILLFGTLENDDTPYAILCKLLQQRSRSLLDTMQLIDQNSFNAAISMIFSARKIALFGGGYSCFAAEYLGFNLERLGMTTVFHRDQVYQAIHAELLTELDLAIAFTASGHGGSIKKCLSKAKANGCPTIVVTCSSGTELLAYADCVLLTTYSDPDILQDTNNAIIEQMAISAAITMSAANSDKHKALQMISKTAANDE